MEEGRIRGGQIQKKRAEEFAAYDPAADYSTSTISSMVNSSSSGSKIKVKDMRRDPRDVRNQHQRSNSRDRVNTGERKERKRSRSREPERSHPISHTSQPVAKEMRELFVGNVISADASEAHLRDYLNRAMRRAGLARETSKEDPIVNCRMSTKFCFIEFRNMEDTNRALNLNGIPYMGTPLRIGRPAKYNGPNTPCQTWQELMGEDWEGGQINIIDPASKVCKEIFVGNTTEAMTDIMLRDFLGGALQSLGLSSSIGSQNPVSCVRVNGKYAFAELRTLEDAANILNLDNVPFMGAFLKLSRPSKFEEVSNIRYFNWEELLSCWKCGDLKVMTAGTPSRILRITNMFRSSDLTDHNFVDDIIEDTKQECSNFGRVSTVVIPSRDDTLEYANIEVDKVFVAMSSEEEATRVLCDLKGRTFDGRIVDVKYYPENLFYSKVYDHDIPKVVITASHGPTEIDTVISSKLLQQCRAFDTPQFDFR